MNKKAIFLSVFLILFFLVGCGQTEQYGGPISDAPKVSVKEVMTQAANLEGETVKVGGKIVTECPTGCWFEVKDESGILYVDIKPSGLSIPQHVGRDVVVEGVVTKGQRGAPMIIGRKVKIK